MYFKLFKSVLKNYKQFNTLKCQKCYFNLQPEPGVPLQARILRYLEQKNNIPNIPVTINNFKKCDQNLCKKINSMTIDEYFGYVHNLIKYVPTRVAQTNLFSFMMYENLKFKEMNSKNKIQYLFYLSILKKHSDTKKLISNSLLEIQKDFITKLNLEDLCIVCLSAFKSSTVIQNPEIFHRLKFYLESEPQLYEDSQVLIILIKTLRHNKRYDMELMKIISKNINVSILAFPAKAHTLALYASALFYKPNVIDSLVDECLHDLQEKQPGIRFKNILTFVWALGFLRYDISGNTDFQSIIIKEVLAASKMGRSMDGEIVDVILSLLMIDCVPKELVGLLDHNLICNIQENGNYRQKSRLNLILTYFDHTKQYPELSRNKIFKFKRKCKTGRSSLLKIKSILLELLPEDTEVLINSQIAAINIEGITIRHGQKSEVEIEVLDEIVCLRNTAEAIPHGIMHLKLKILEAMNIPIIQVINFEGTDPDQLDKFLWNQLIQLKIINENIK